MSYADQQIQVTISRIFNCSSHYLNTELTIQFRTLLSQTPIFTKVINALGSSATLRLNFSLKITYNPTQTHLIAQIFTPSKNHSMTYLIDLQLVQQRKMIFIKQEDGVSMMQVDCKKLQIKQKEKEISQKIPKKAIIEDFISQKEKLISVISGKSGTNYKSRDNFAQGIYELLQQTRQIRKCGEQNHQFDNLSTSKKSDCFGEKSARQYMIGEYKLSLKNLKMKPTEKRAFRSQCSPDCKKAG